MAKSEMEEVYDSLNAEQLKSLENVVNQLVSYGFSVEEASEMVLIKIKEMRDKKKI